MLVPLFSEDTSHKEPPHDALGLSSEADSELSEKAGVSGEVGVLDSRVSRSTKELLAAQAEEDEEEEEDPDVYYFESDHLALKHNKEYVQVYAILSEVVIAFIIVVNKDVLCLLYALLFSFICGVCNGKHHCYCSSYCS